MQESCSGSYRDTNSSHTEETKGLLENTDRVELKNNGIVAILKGFIKTTDSQEDTLKYQVYSYKCLRWTHTGAMRLLQGMGPQQILGPQYILVSGRHRAITNPDPGIDDIMLLEVIANPERLSAMDIFAKAISK